MNNTASYDRSDLYYRFTLTDRVRVHVRACVSGCVRARSPLNVAFAKGQLALHHFNPQYHTDKIRWDGDD